jgi:hypothetical protein
MSIELVISLIIENAFNIDSNTMFAVTFRAAIVTLLIVFDFILLLFVISQVFK